MLLYSNTGNIQLINKQMQKYAAGALYKIFFVLVLPLAHIYFKIIWFYLSMVTTFQSLMV